MCHIHHTVSSYYNHQSNRKAEAYLKFMKFTRKKYFETNTDVYLALLQIRSTPLGPRLLKPTMLIFNRLARDLLPMFSRLPMLFDDDDNNDTVDIKRQFLVNIPKDTHENVPFLSTG